MPNVKKNTNIIKSLAHETIISLVKQCEAVFIYLHLTQ